MHPGATGGLWRESCAGQRVRDRECVRTLAGVQIHPDTAPLGAQAAALRRAGHSWHWGGGKQFQGGGQHMSLAGNGARTHTHERTWRGPSGGPLNAAVEVKGSKRRVSSPGCKGRGAKGGRVARPQGTRGSRAQEPQSAGVPMLGSVLSTRCTQGDSICVPPPKTQRPPRQPQATACCGIPSLSSAPRAKWGGQKTRPAVRHSVHRLSHICCWLRHRDTLAAWGPGRPLLHSKPSLSLSHTALSLLVGPPARRAQAWESHAVARVGLQHGPL